MQVGKRCLELELCARLLVVKGAGREPGSQGCEKAEEEINSESRKVHGGEVACEQGLD